MAFADRHQYSEQETQRLFETSNVDARTEHEVYEVPFIRSVMGGVATVMCAYTRINGTHACENSHLLNDLLK